MYFYILILFCFFQYKLLISIDDLGQVVISGVTHQIIRVKIQDQAGVNLSYELYLRA